MAESVAFDRAVEYYDQTRAVSPEAEAAMVEAVSRELRGRGHVLEIGVGTGRIAVPLARAGVDAIGVDLSEPMLRRLVAKAGDAIPSVRGDATRLPFRTGSFGAAYAVHVLHLIPSWQDAVAELLRVVRPGGVLLVSQGDWSLFAYVDVIEAFAAAAGMELRHLGLNEEADLDGLLARSGATARDLAPIEDVRRSTLREMVDRLRDGLYSFTWGLAPETRKAAADAAAAHAQERHGSLDEERDITTEMRWRAYDLPTA